jgi:hypothetical protein
VKVKDDEDVDVDTLLLNFGYPKLKPLGFNYYRVVLSRLTSSKNLFGHRTVILSIVLG